MIEPTAAPALEQPTSPLAGTLRFVRYAFMPNRLRYCGADVNRTLFDHAVARVDDGGLGPLVRTFTGALPYLQLIARSNGIRDPFDVRVVEAYWIGNSLLERVEVRQLYDALVERFGRQLGGRTREVVLGKAPAGARPHHSFHVLDIHSRLGELEHSLATMDTCRVSWGRVVGVDGGELVVARAPLALRKGRLVLDAVAEDRVARQLDGRGFADDARPGDWVSIHWGWACEVITDAQRTALERWTRHHMAIANQTI
jgi:hydrogenase maturation factor